MSSTKFELNMCNYFFVKDSVKEWKLRLSCVIVGGLIQACSFKITIHSWLNSSAIDARSALSLTSCESIFSSSIKLIGFLLFVVKNSFIGIIFEWIKNHSFFLFKQTETRIQLVLWNRWMEKMRRCLFIVERNFDELSQKEKLPLSQVVAVTQSRGAILRSYL